MFDSISFARYDRLKDTVEDRAIIAHYINFDSRESYLAWRSDWRRTVWHLIAAVRRAREGRKSESWVHQAAAQSQREALRVQGANLMALRRVSKVEAGNQRNYRLAQPDEPQRATGD